MILIGRLLVQMKMPSQSVDGLLVESGAICLMIHVIPLEQLSVFMLGTLLILAGNLMFPISLFICFLAG